jgi:hypothetical protein
MERGTHARATRSKSEPSSDAEIERGLRERAVSEPRAAEILLRWLQRPRAEERVGDVDLDSMSERELERLYAGLLKLAALPDEELHALLSVLAGRRMLSSRLGRSPQMPHRRRGARLCSSACGSGLWDTPSPRVGYAEPSWGRSQPTIDLPRVVEARVIAGEVS